MNMLKGFKDFIMQGNVVDLATAVVIGAAFAGVVNALVDNVLMPLISALVGAPDYDQFFVVTINDNDLRFGVLLTQVVNFLLIAAAIYFVVIMPMNKIIEARHKVLGEPEEELEKTDELLTEIRDLLQSQAQASGASDGTGSGPTGPAGAGPGGTAPPAR